MYFLYIPFPKLHICIGQSNQQYTHKHFQNTGDNHVGLNEELKRVTIANEDKHFCLHGLVMFCSTVVRVKEPWRFDINKTEF